MNSRAEKSRKVVKSREKLRKEAAKNGAHNLIFYTQKRLRSQPSDQFSEASDGRSFIEHQNLKSLPSTTALKFQAFRLDGS